MAHKKRKDSSSPGIQFRLGTAEVPVNPSEEQPPSKAPALSIPSESFALDGIQNQIHSYSLIIRVFPSSAMAVRLIIQAETIYTYIFNYIYIYLYINIYIYYMYMPGEP